MLDSKTCYPRRKEGVISRTLGDETILYDPESRKVHVLNKTSLAIWELCTGETNLELIEQRFRARFRVEEGEDVRRDVEESVAAFTKEGLLLLESR